MKTQFKFLFSAITFLLIGTVAVAGFQSDPAEEVPGDNFSLEGALELFKKSASPQEFEQLLNSPDSKVNNLDLNGDGEIDYVRVIDKNEGNVHAFILQAAVSTKESQDIAVIELEKRNDGSAVLQIVGDADVYGIETIIEPTEEVRVNAGASTARTVVNVWAWPSVQYVYGPYYNAWVSPWNWGYYPGWYRPWRPIAWQMYDPFWASYRPYYSVCYRHRVMYAPVIYRPYRATSVIVHNRHYTQINTFRNTSHGYRYDRSAGQNAHNYNNGRTRSDYTNGSRSDYSNSRRSDYTNRGKTRSDVKSNNGRSGSDVNSNGNSNGRRKSFTPTERGNKTDVNKPANDGSSLQRNNDRRSSFNRTPNSTTTESSGRQQQRSFSVPTQRQSSTPTQRSFSAPTQRQSSAPAQRSFSAPQKQSAPQHQSAPRSGGGGGNGGGGGGGHRRH